MPTATVRMCPASTRSTASSLHSPYAVSLYLVMSLQIAKYRLGSPVSSKNGTIVAPTQ